MNTYIHRGLGVITEAIIIVSADSKKSAITYIKNELDKMGFDNQVPKPELVTGPIIYATNGIICRHH